MNTCHLGDMQTPEKAVTGQGNAPVVRIHDLSGYAPLRVYEAASEADCYGETDRSVFREVMRSGEVITMGKTIGEPI